jgi:23S rRNA (pseudouridine1915-N3)-methyltransferase
MDLEILMIGKFKNPHVSALVDGYVERTRRFCPCRVRGLRESRYADEGKDGPRIMAEEGTRFLEALNPDAYCVALDSGGCIMDSMRFSRFLDEHLIQSRRRLAFVVGGFLGLSPPVKERAALTLSISAWTLPHELAVLVLAEQLYRALTILRHVPYHK